jgi:hypothetical protein
MITGVHALIYSTDAEADRAFFRDVLRFDHIDSGGGWLIFALPPAELGVHPIDEGEAGRHELYLMRDDIQATVLDLEGRGVVFDGPISDAGFGRLSSMRLPGGGQLAIYEPKHPTAI